MQQTLEDLKQGKLLKRPRWSGYWEWNHNSKSIMMHTKDDTVLDFRETQDLTYTLVNFMAEDFYEATVDNCPILAIEYEKLKISWSCKSTRYLNRNSVADNYLIDLLINEIVESINYHDVGKTIVACVLTLRNGEEVLGYFNKNNKRKAFYSAVNRFAESEGVNCRI